MLRPSLTALTCHQYDALISPASHAANVREPRETDLEVLELADLLCLPRNAALRVYAQVG